MQTEASPNVAQPTRASVLSCAKRLCRKQQLDDVLHNVSLHASVEDSIIDSSCVADLADNDDFVEQRGLEKWSSSRHSTLRSVKIVEVRTALFLEQASPMMSGRNDPDLIAKVTSDASRSSRSLAQYLASADAAVAMRVRQEYLQELRNSLASADTAVAMRVRQEYLQEQRNSVSSPGA